MRFMLPFFLIAGLTLAYPAIVVCATEDITDITVVTVSENDTVSDNDISHLQDGVDLSADDPGSGSFDSSEYVDFSGFSDSLFLTNELLSSLENDIALLSDYSGITNAIPELYLDYMRDVLSWSTLGDKYVAFSSSYVLYNNTYTYYVLVVGDITFSGSAFSGSDVDVYEFFPQVTTFSGNTNYRHSIQATFSYRPNGYLCFTDLSANYPNIRGTTNNYLFIIIVILSFVITFYTVTKFGWGNAAIRRRSRRRTLS